MASRYQQELQSSIKKYRNRSIVGYGNEIVQVDCYGIRYIDLDGKGVKKWVHISGKNGFKSGNVLFSAIKPIILNVEWLKYVGFERKKNFLEKILPKKIFIRFFGIKYEFQDVTAKIDKDNNIIAYNKSLGLGPVKFVHELQNLSGGYFNALEFYHIKYMV